MQVIKFKPFFLLITFCLLAPLVAVSQSIAEQKKIEITFNKTSSLVFPASIVSVDRGSRDVLAQKAPGVHNVLQLKAARQNFPETNLTVITSDGTLHQFTITYARVPLELASGITNPNHAGETVPVIFTTEMTEPEMELYAETILASKPFIHLKRDRSYKMGLSLHGIYSAGDMMFYRLQIANHSNIGYDVDYLRFFIRDSRKAKRTSSQELTVRPLFVHGDDKAVRGKSKQTVVYAIDKFTIPDAKRLYIQVMEHSGGRHLELKVTNRTIVHARSLKQ